MIQIAEGRSDNEIHFRRVCETVLKSEYQPCRISLSDFLSITDRECVLCEVRAEDEKNSEDVNITI